ncbi:trehalose-phosphatase [Allopusillimonas soli]|uniref:Trehalose 6-phosphate phosphatase n=1 Tax=Allopusillimonas soli TaxID=659016 RepID=A0A853FFE9_9BURK|nr:trehalose-phosphatase [Allopusillimonas soli]NYT38599.1 trehalose-phosphatase [Allopusillimonas soli]TEA71687.1 trehalose-phosphatase [Allopusillimonas soli]
MRALQDFIPDSLAWAFFFDLDGTLAPLAERPEQASVPPATLGMLERLGCIAGGALAVISGRPLETLDVLLQPLVLPLGAEHGAIIRDSSGNIHAPANDAAGIVRALADALDESLGGMPGVLLERKNFGIAVHYRQAPEAADAVRGIMQTVRSRFPQFELLPGKMVVEAKLPGVDKGRALSYLMRDIPFAGRKPLMVGDDTTDETAFREANALGGTSVKIGPGATSARLRLAAQDALPGWIERIVEAGAMSGASDNA